jgi:hypothetical protein
MSEGLKTYGDSEEYGKEEPAEDARHEDAGPGGLVPAKEAAETALAPYPKPMDAKFTHEFPNDPFGDTNPDGGFKYEKVWSPSEMKNSPFAIFKE